MIWMFDNIWSNGVAFVMLPRICVLSLLRSVWGGKDYVATFEGKSPLLRLYEPEATKDFVHFLPVSQYRHDTAFTPHTVCPLIRPLCLYPRTTARSAAAACGAHH